jgi:hypothetical protein
VSLKSVDIETFGKSISGWSEFPFGKTEVLICYDSRVRCFMGAEGRDVHLAFVGYETSILGRKSLITLPFAPNIGPIWRPLTGKNPSRITRGKKLLHDLVSFLDAGPYFRIELNLPPEIRDVQPAVWAGWDVRVRYTYRLDLEQSEVDIFNGYEDKLKSQLRDFNPSSVRFESLNAKNAALIFKELEEKNALAHPELASRLCDALGKHGGEIITVVGQKGTPLASAATVKSDGLTYYLFGGVNPEGRQAGAGPMALHASILRAKESQSHTFDFEGSMIPGVERYFRQFGGEIVPYYSLTKRMTSYYRLKKLLGKG